MIPTTAEILQLAHTQGYGTITHSQAQRVRTDLEKMSHYDRPVLVEVALVGLASTHSANMAAMAAALVDDPGLPDGFDDAEVSHWYIQQSTGVITRDIDLEVPNRTRNALVTLSYVDTIVDGHLERHGPTASVDADQNFTRDELLSLADALIAAARVLAEHDS